MIEPQEFAVTMASDDTKTSDKKGFGNHGFEKHWWETYKWLSPFLGSAFNE